MASYDILGNIAVLKIEGKERKEILSQARELMKKPGIKSVYEKAENVKGRLRTIKVRHILGENNKIAFLKENNCRFKLDIETCYFSPRLSNERKEIASRIRRQDRVLVMFSGVGVYPIVIYKNARCKQVVGIELGRQCHKFALENLKLNKIPEDKIKLIQGDVKRKINSGLGKFDVIVMPRPNLKESFLIDALKVAGKGTKIYYYAFGHVDEIIRIKNNLILEAEKAGKKIRILKTLRAGDIAPYKFRFRIEMIVC